jgi:hypothetical protein
MKRGRINVYLEREYETRLREWCAIRGLSKSEVIAAAVASFLSPESADRREAAIAKRLDKLTQQYERLARDQMIEVETLALFIRYFLSVSSPVPEGHQEAARAQGKARFAQFIEQLARHLQRGGSLVKEVSEEIYPSGEQFFSDKRRDSSAGDV